MAELAAAELPGSQREVHGSFGVHEAGPDRIYPGGSA